MSDKDVNIHVIASGAEEASKGLDKVADSTKRVGSAVEESAPKATGETNKLADSFGRLKDAGGTVTTALTGWALKLASIATAISLVTSAVRVQIDAMREHAQLIADRQQQLTALQYLNGFFKENPNLREEVAKKAEFGRRDFGEVATAWYGLRSKAGGLSTKQQGDILDEALEYGRPVPNAPLGPIVDVFTTFAKKGGMTDANRIQNVVSEAIAQSGGGAEDAARPLSEFLPIGMAGGMTASQSAGLWSYVSSQASEPRQATSGLRNIFMALQGKGTPETNKLLRRSHISPKMGFFEKFSILSQRYGEGKFSLDDAEQIAGPEGASLLLAMLKNPSDMANTINRVTAADRPDIDITKKNINELLGSDEIAFLADRDKKLQLQIENQKARDVGALRKTVAIRKQEKYARDTKSPEYFIQLAKKTQEFLYGVTGHTIREDDFDPNWPGQSPVIINHHDNSTHYYNGQLPTAKPRYSQD